MISCFYLHATSAERKNKIALIQTLKRDLLCLQNKYNPDITTLICDANITLDQPLRDPVACNELRSLLNILQVKDSFRELNPNCAGFTFFPPKVTHKPSRLDYVFISEICLQKQNKPKIALIPTHKTGSDHLGIRFSVSSYSFDRNDIKMLQEKTWKFKDHLLYDSVYTSSLKNLIKTFLISISPFNLNNGGLMSVGNL